MDSSTKPTWYQEILSFISDKWKGTVQEPDLVWHTYQVYLLDIQYEVQDVY